MARGSTRLVSWIGPRRVGGLMPWVSGNYTYKILVGDPGADVECSMDLWEVAPTPPRTCSRRSSENTSAWNSLWPTTRIHRLAQRLAQVAGLRRLVPIVSAPGDGQRHRRCTIKGVQGRSRKTLPPVTS